MNTALCRLFGWSSESASQTEIFVRTMSVVAAIAGVTHVIFLMMFWFLGVMELAALNVASVAVYALAVWLVRQRPFLTEGLMGLEIALHGVIAVYLVGWDSGFHFYMVLMIPTALVSGGPSDRASAWARWIGGLGVGLLYLLIDAYMRFRPPVHVLPSSVLAGLHTFNLAGTLMILGLLSLVYRQLILQAASVLRHQACTDPLTQLHNRRAVLDVLQHEASSFVRQGRPLSVILADVDHFKSINDKHGHHAGDAVLQAVAGVFNGAVRKMDHVARWGGEEFLIVLPGTGVDEAYVVAERLRAHVAAHVCQSDKGPIPVTMTLGLADMQDGDTVEQLISRADQALYDGKQAGRNRVVVDAAANDKAK